VSDDVVVKGVRLLVGPLFVLGLFIHQGKNVQEQVTSVHFIPAIAIAPLYRQY
jgi:hypothetical protein